MIPHKEKLQKQVQQHPHSLLFATISGAHLYGFPSDDSDFDLRGAHVLPLRDVIGLEAGQETVDISGIRDGLEIDLVTHDVRKFMTLMLKKNGYVMEQLLSPLVVSTTVEHDELKSIAPKCLTCHHAHHYLGFAATQWKLFQNNNQPLVKPLLYVYRVLLTGIHLMQTGEVEANLLRLNEVFGLSYLPDLIRQKVDGPEKGTLETADIAFHESEYHRLVAALHSAYEGSHLPENNQAKPALNDLLTRIRLKAGEPDFLSTIVD